MSETTCRGESPAAAPARVIRLAAAVAAGVGGAAIFFFGAHNASAEVVDPHSAYQPAALRLVSRSAGPATTPVVTLAANPVTKPSPAALSKPAPATPAPEPVIVPAPRPAFHRGAPAGGATRTPVSGVPRSFAYRVGSYLERVTSSCPAGLPTGTGGPVVVLAVLGVGLALTRHRMLGTRAATDEDVPLLLFAWEPTPPG